MAFSHDGLRMPLWAVPIMPMARLMPGGAESPARGGCASWAQACCKVVWLDWDPHRPSPSHPGLVSLQLRFSLSPPVCLPRAPGSWGWLEVPGSNGYTGGEEKGEGQDPLLEKEAAHEATEAGWKAHREENWQIHRGPQDPWILSLSPIKLTVYSLKKKRKR